MSEERGLIVQEVEELESQRLDKKSVLGALSSLDNMLENSLKDVNAAWSMLGNDVKSYYWLCEKLTKAQALCDKIAQFMHISSDIEKKSIRMKEMHAAGTIAASKKRKKDLKEKPHD